MCISIHYCWGNILRCLIMTDSSFVFAVKCHWTVQKKMSQRGREGAPVTRWHFLAVSHLTWDLFVSCTNLWRGSFLLASPHIPCVVRHHYFVCLQWSTRQRWEWHLKGTITKHDYLHYLRYFHYASLHLANFECTDFSSPDFQCFHQDVFKRKPENAHKCTVGWKHNHVFTPKDAWGCE